MPLEQLLEALYLPLKLMNARMIRLHWLIFLFGSVFASYSIDKYLQQVLELLEHEQIL